jgi:hypothetical protein
MIAGCPVASTLDGIGRAIGSGSWGRRKGGSVDIDIKGLKSRGMRMGIIVCIGRRRGRGGVEDWCSL